MSERVAPMLIRPLPVLLAAAVMALAAATQASAAEPAAIECRWQDPTSGMPLSVRVADAALVAVAPGAFVEIILPQGVMARLAGDRLFVDSFRIAAPANPGPGFIDFTLETGNAGTPIRLCLYAAHTARTRPSGSPAGTILSVEDEEIGLYRRPQDSPTEKVKGNPASYAPPRLFLRMTPETEGLAVWPGVRLRDLVIPTESTGERHTQLVPVNYPMWRAIGTVRRALEEQGIPGDALKLLSVFRTPPYNRSVGSGAYGRHVYGDAFDFYVDSTGDGMMDNLTGTGRPGDRSDALWLVGLIEELQGAGRLPPGGVGAYTYAGGPRRAAVHVDLRGHRATWGSHRDAAGRASGFAWQSRVFAAEDAQEEAERRAKAAAKGESFSAARREALPPLRRPVAAQ